MAATMELKIYYGTTAGTEVPVGNATNWNLMSTDAYDSTGVAYQTNKVQTPASGTSYSYERWFRLEFSGVFNNVTNMAFWHSAGSLSDSNIDLKAGSTTVATTPVNTVSSVATNTLEDWDTEVEEIALNNGGDLSAAGYSDYGVLQLVVPSTVTTSGDIGTQTISMEWDED